MLDTHAPAPLKALLPQFSVRDRLQRSISWVQALPNRILEIGSAIQPVAGYLRSGLFLLAASVKQHRGSNGHKTTLVDLLSWASLDTWRTRLLKEAEVALTVSQQTSLSLLEMPAVRRILDLVWEHRRLVRDYAAEKYPGTITLFRAVRPRSSGQSDEDLTLGWEILAEGGVEVHPLQANHIALLVKPYVEILAQELMACLDRGSD